MQPRAALLVLSLGLLLLAAPTPYPVHFADQLQAVRTALRAGRPDLALQPLESALARLPDSAELRLEAVQVALAAGRPDRAEGLIEQLPSRLRHTDQAACFHAQAAAQLGEWPAALRWSASAGPQCGEPRSALRQQASAMIGSGQYGAAHRLLEGLAALDPVHPETHLMLGLLEATSRPEQALSRLILVSELDPQQRLPRALIEAIESGLERGNTAYTLAQVGQSLARAGEWGLAAEAFRNALASAPGYTEARAYLGLALDRSGQDGLEQLERAAAEAPQAALPQQLLGRHWRARGEPALALAAFEAAAGLAPEDPLIAADLGAAYAAVGDLPAAQAAYVRAAELAPRDPVMWLLLAQFSIEFEVELKPVGIPAARRALALQPGSAEALDLLGYAYYRAGNWELAERFLNRAVAADPQAASAHYHLGLLQLSRGRTAAGVRTLQLASHLDPGGRIGSLAQRSLENLP